MTEEEFELACQDIIQKYSEQLDIRIKIDKECIDSHNQSIKKVRNYKSKLLTYLRAMSEVFRLDDSKRIYSVASPKFGRSYG